MKALNKINIKECDIIIQEGLKAEITATIQVILEGKYSSKKIETYTRTFFMTQEIYLKKFEK